MIPAISLLSSTTRPIEPTLIISGPKSSKPRTPSLNQTSKSISISDNLDEAIRRIVSSPSEYTDPDTYARLLHTCISHKSLHHGQIIYQQLQLLSKHRTGYKLIKNPTLKSKLITLFSTCNRLEDARCVFEDGCDSEGAPESVWTALAIGYLKNKRFREAVLVYVDMLSHNVQPGNFSFSVALKACVNLNDLRLGRGVHGQVIKSGADPDQVVYNAALTLYGQFGCSDDALKLFDKMPQRNVVSWNSLIAGFSKQDRLFASLDVFRRMMQCESVEFSWVTITIVLSICARLTALYSGKELHGQIIKSKNIPDVLVLNSVIDMYGKCGLVDYGRRLFNGMRNKDLASWNAMLTGYTINGCMREAMEFFNEMISSGMNPDEVTFISLLSGCSHASLTEDGKKLFYRMKKDFGVLQCLEHYACLVDLLGRAGRIEDAMAIVKTMPMKPSSSMWGSLLNSCYLHGNLSFVESIAEQLFELEPNNPGNYVILSNIYANAGMWDSVNKVREMMLVRGIKKEAGCSWIQVKNKFHTFVAGGGFEFRNSTEYKKIWNELSESMKEIGYIPDTSVVLHDVNEETKATWVCGHSERLATIFALVNTADGMPIRITKNLRICKDCHSWIKIVSRITGRMIVVRDTNRFHHFKEGTCSCNDFW